MPAETLNTALCRQAKWAGKAVFGYRLATDTWYGCGNGLWWTIEGGWPPTLLYESLDVQGMSFRIVSAQDLQRFGYEGASLPAMATAR